MEVCSYRNFYFCVGVFAVVNLKGHVFLFLLLTAFSKRRITNTRKRAITNCALHYRNHWFCKFYWHWVDCGLQWKTSQILNAACEAKNFTPSPRLKTTSCKVCKHSIHLVPAPKLYNLLPKHLRDLLALSSLRNLETYKCYANLLRCMLIAQTAFYNYSSWYLSLSFYQLHNMLQY